MQIEIVTIGNEVLSGRTLDTNFAWLARALERVSVQIGWHSTCSDSAERIAEALRRALERADAVVLTGGLGPTPDDVTRKTVATVLGRPLVLHEPTLQSIRERAQKLRRKLPESVQTQALIPRGAEAWPNPIGTAPGLLILQGDKPVILLPGVPQEMEGLASAHAVPYLQARTGAHVETFTLRTTGTFESLLQERIGALPKNWVGASLAYLPGLTGVDLRVTVTGSDAAMVREVARGAHAELLAAVRPVVYSEGERGMEEVVGETLTELGYRLALAESCTGGLLAKRITDVAGSSAYFERGFVTYSNLSKIELLGVSAEDLDLHGAVSAEIAEQMARGARARAGVEVGLAVTGVAGPGGGSAEKPVGLVFIAVSSPLGEGTRKLNLTGTRGTVRERATHLALDLLRRQLEGLPLEPRL